MQGWIDRVTPPPFKMGVKLFRSLLKKLWMFIVVNLLVSMG